MQDAPIRSGSHRVTNDVIHRLILARIQPDSQVVDFGAGPGHMCQRLGAFFSGHGRNIDQQLTPCEVAPEIFQYREAHCRKIGIHSEIPVEDASQDLIYAIEVMEHLPRPYDFLLEAGKKLKPGGSVIFSVPNLLHLKSRLQLLLTGYADMFGPPSTEDRNAGRICGHIMPLSYAYFVYGLKRAGFEDIEFHADRLKRSSLILGVLGYPFLWVGAWFNDRALKKYDTQVWHANRPLVWRVNQLDMLASRSCVITARKPSR